MRHEKISKVRNFKNYISHLTYILTDACAMRYPKSLEVSLIISLYVYIYIYIFLAYSEKNLFYVSERDIIYAHRHFIREISVTRYITDTISFIRFFFSLFSLHLSPFREKFSIPPSLFLSFLRAFAVLQHI